MNAAVATVIAAAVGVIGAIIGALINAAFARGGQRADIADKISDAWDPVFQRYDRDMANLDAKCTRCTEALSRSLDVNETVLDVMEQYLDLIEGKRATDEDHEDVRATIRTARREVRELRP